VDIEISSADATGADRWKVYGTSGGLVGDGVFKALDTGSAVKSRKAAKAQGRNVPVVDVYLSSRRRVDEVTRLLGRDGHFMRVVVR
jgi:hypothetical protein